MTLLDRIDSPADLKALSAEELKQLAAELRTYLVDTISTTGGHISSSLGVVELTLALHRVFDSPRDKLVWDTGHQGYIHKLLTGRRDRFDTMRQFNGVSGFLVRTESEHDVFGAGHAGTSISAAQGMAVARDLRHERQHVVAIIGDGALTAGMAMEALNDVGHKRTRLIVVLNDNGMSIAPNVGAVSRMLEALRTARPYRSFKHLSDQLIEHMPAGDLAEEARRRFITSLKALLMPNLLFEQFGFTYFGPVDGHDLEATESLLRKARDFQNGPVLVHVHTQKGHGYGPAEDDNVKWHGVSPAGSKPPSTPTYTRVFADTVRELMRADERVVAVTAAMPDGTGLTPLFNEFPGRVFDVGISEQHAVTFAAGLATQGVIPIVAIYSTFLQRGFDQVVHDVAVQHLPVVLAMDRAGIVGDDGRTHQGLFDISYLRPLPGMTLMAPKDEGELRHMLHTAVSHARANRGPIGLRYPRGSGVGADVSGPLVELRIGEAELLREGTDLVIAAYGTVAGEALAAAAELAESGIDATVVNARFVKPLDEDLFLGLAARTPRIATVEEHAVAGGFGSALAELFHERTAAVELAMLGVPDEFVDHGAQKLWRAHYGLDAAGIAAAVRSRWPYLVKTRAEKSAG
ncbi:MAG: 1-deoxy-D-xylulose-5-phosphate synthase [Chloroflexi bacterium]|nr:MAG: 1-deoxy-D-xylulose-5-phosphate synthase [Chloroflexota bacterium]